MRIGILALAALGIAACDSGNVPSPAERLNNPNAAVEADVDPGLVLLRSDGLNAGVESFYFAAGKNEVVGALTRVLGQPNDVASLPECGAGPMESARFEGGLTVMFQDGNFVGWYQEQASDAVRLAGNGKIGTSRAELEVLPNFSMIEGSTLGEEFALGDQIGGFLEGDAVSGLYSGTQCFFR